MATNFDGRTKDLERMELDKLRSIFPDCFVEDKLNIDKLLTIVGEHCLDDFEKYEFRWKGKSEALLVAQQRSMATLRPCVEESIDWDNTQNLYIEGDNLEVLRLLQKSYHRSVKLIYIDPPYNTGNDFVYKDDYTDSIGNYKRITEQDLRSNADTSGRYHTDWLNMMYPRLRMAKHLLRDDGVIFISIDDNEAHNLRKVCDEVFGEDNFVSTIACVNKPSGRSDDKYIATAHESIVIYRRSDLFSMGGFEPDENITRRYSKTDKNGNRYREEDLRKRGSHDERTDRPNLFYPFFYNENTDDLIIGNNEDDTLNGYIRIVPMKSSTVEGNWRWGKETAKEMIAYLHPRYMPNKEQWSVFEWEYLSERVSVKPTSVWDFKDVNSERGTEIFVKILGFDKNIFQNPKPIGTIERIINIATNSNENNIVLDFFSGSATTAHAVMQLNAEDGGNRRFIMVQLPEKCAEDSEAYNAGYVNICEIGKERIRRAGAKIITESDNQMNIGETGEEKSLDVGFRIFKLDTSNIKKWDSTPINKPTPEQVDLFMQRLNDMIDSVKHDRTNLDMVFEILLKLGNDLCEPVTPIEVDGVTAYAIGAECRFMVCLDDKVTVEIAEQMAEYAPGLIVFGDKCFKDTTALANVDLALKDMGIDIQII